MNACLHVCMHTTCVPGVYRGQNKASDTVELELEMVANYHVATGTQTQVLWKSNKFSFLFVFNKFIYSFILHPSHSFSFLLSSQSLPINSLPPNPFLNRPQILSESDWLSSLTVTPLLHPWRYSDWQVSNEVCRTPSWLRLDFLSLPAAYVASFSTMKSSQQGVSF